MRRWFHAAAAAFFLLSALSGLGPDPGGDDAQPRSQLIALLGRSGLRYRGEHRLFEGGWVLDFRPATCSSDVEVVYLPSLSRIDAAMLAKDGGGRATTTYVYDGEVIGGLQPLDLGPRWLWRKLQVMARLRSREPWQSIALALVAPRGCAAPPIDWTSLASR